MLSRENGGGGGAHASPPRSPLSRPLLDDADDDEDDIAAAFAPALARPLLLIEEDTEDADDGGDGGGEQGAAPIKKWRLEARRLLALSLPLSMMSVLSYVGRAVTLSQVGALGALELSAVSLAGALYNVTGLSLVLGLASGAETFMGQAAGMREHSVMGLVLQRAALVSAAFAALPAAAWWCAAPALLRALGQNAEVAALAAAYVRAQSPALPIAGLNAALTAFLAMQGAVRPLAAAAGAAAALTPAANQLFMHTFQFGVVGAAAASIATHAAQALLLVGFAWMLNARHSPADDRPWQGLSTEAFAQLPEYMAVALPATLFVACAWWAFEAATLIAGLLPDARAALGACGVLFAVHVLGFLCIDGIGYAVKIRVARALGAGAPAAARRALLVGLGLAVACGVALASALLAAPRAAARAFTRDAAVVDAFASAAPWLALMLTLDVSAVVKGALAGCGRQRTGLAIDFAGFWLVGLPLGAWRALSCGAGVAGLWQGLAAGAGAQLALSAIVAATCDWPHEAGRSLDLVRSQSSRFSLPRLRSSSIGGLRGGRPSCCDEERRSEVADGGTGGGSNQVEPLI